MLLKILKCNACSFLWCSLSQPVMVFVAVFCFDFGFGDCLFILLFSVALSGQGDTFMVHTDPPQKLGVPCNHWLQGAPSYLLLDYHALPHCGQGSNAKHLLFLQACLPNPQHFNLHPETLKYWIKEGQEAYHHRINHKKNKNKEMLWYW